MFDFFMMTSVRAEAPQLRPCAIYLSLLYSSSTSRKKEMDSGGSAIATLRLLIITLLVTSVVALCSPGRCSEYFLLSPCYMFIEEQMCRLKVIFPFRFF